MSTRINVNVDSGGLLERDKQQRVANRTARLIKENAAKAAEEGKKQRNKRREAEGLDPVTGLPIPSPGSSSNIRRYDQEPAANRQEMGSMLPFWILRRTDIQSAQQTYFLGTGSANTWTSFVRPPNTVQAATREGDIPTNFSFADTEAQALAVAPSWVNPAGLLPTRLLEPRTYFAATPNSYVCAPNGIMNTLTLKADATTKEVEYPFYYAKYDYNEPISSSDHFSYCVLPESEASAYFLCSQEQLAGYGFTAGLFTADQGGFVKTIEYFYMSPWAYATDVYGPVWDRLIWVGNDTREIKRISYDMGLPGGTEETQTATFSVMRGTREQYSFYYNSSVSGENLVRKENGSVDSGYPDEPGWPQRFRFTEFAAGEVLAGPLTATNVNLVAGQNQPRIVDVNFSVGPGDYIWIRIHSTTDTTGRTLEPWGDGVPIQQQLRVSLFRRAAGDPPLEPIEIAASNTSGYNDAWVPMGSGSGVLSWPPLKKAYHIKKNSITERSVPPQADTLIVNNLFGKPTITQEPGEIINVPKSVHNNSTGSDNYVSFVVDPLQIRGTIIAFGRIFQIARAGGSEISDWVTAPSARPGTSELVFNPEVRPLTDYPISLGFYLGFLPETDPPEPLPLDFPPLKTVAPVSANPFTYMHYTPVIYNAIENLYKGDGLLASSRLEYGAPSVDVRPNTQGGFYKNYSEIEDIFPDNPFVSVRPFTGGEIFTLDTPLSKALLDELLSTGTLLYNKGNSTRSELRQRLVTGLYPGFDLAESDNYETVIFLCHTWNWNKPSLCRQKLRELGFVG
jgi:hypothetical protein